MKTRKKIKMNNNTNNNFKNNKKKNKLFLVLKKIYFFNFQIIKLV